MTWNYRVIRSKLPDEDIFFAIYEVYYDGKRIVSCTQDPVLPHGHSLKELKADLKHYLTALDKPVLKMEDIENKAIFKSLQMPQEDDTFYGDKE